MTYVIQPRTYEQAKRLGVTVKVSSNPKKKIDVFKDGVKIASIGAIGMGDFPTYYKTKGAIFANERRRLYHLRHKDGAVNSPAWLSKRLLW